MSKSQLQTNNTRLSQLITELQGKALGGGSIGGSLETGTLTTVTSFVISANQNYYADLESIPDIASKHLVVLHYTDSSRYNPSWVLTRNSLDDEFSVSAVSGGQTFHSGCSLTGYVFSINQSADVVGDLTYYAV